MEPQALSRLASRGHRAVYDTATPCGLSACGLVAITGTSLALVAGATAAGYYLGVGPVSSIITGTIATVLIDQSGINSGIESFLRSHLMNKP